MHCQSNLSSSSHGLCSVFFVDLFYHFLKCFPFFLVSLYLVAYTVVSFVEDFHILSVVHPWPLVFAAIQHGHSSKLSRRFTSTSRVKRRLKFELATLGFVCFPHEWAVQAPDFVGFLGSLAVVVGCIELFFGSLVLLSLGPSGKGFGRRSGVVVGHCSSHAGGVETQRWWLRDLRLGPSAHALLR